MCEVCSGAVCALLPVRRTLAALLDSTCLVRMNTTTIIEELEDVAGRLGFEVRTEKGNFRGGRCVMGDEELIMLNKRHQPETQLVVMAEALRDAPLDTIYLKPAVRQALEDTWAQLDAASEEASHVDG
jgi:hypothetical protein